MKTSHFRAAFAWVVAALLLAPPAFGDAPCYKDYRTITAAEKARMTAVLEAVKSAMPPAPAGWVVASTDDFSLPDSMCKDFELVPFQFHFGRTYRNVGSNDAREKIIEAQAARYQAQQAQKQPRIDAIQAKTEKLVKAQVALIEKGDYAGAEKYNMEIDKLQKEMGRVMDEGRDPAQEAADARAYAKDNEMYITVEVNPWAAGANPGATTMTGPPGAQSAWRWRDEGQDLTTDNELYLFGTWKPNNRGGWRGISRSGVSLFGAHFLTVKVTADPDRIRNTVAAIDFAKLAATLR